LDLGNSLKTSEPTRRKRADVNISRTPLFLTGILNIGWLILTFDNVKGGLKAPKKAKV